MTQRVIRERDFLFLYHLLFPLCGTYFSVIQEDKHIPCYSDVDKWSNIYAYQIVLGVSYVHGFKHVKLPEIVCHDGCIVRYGIHGGTSGAIYRRWHMGAD